MKLQKKETNPEIPTSSMADIAFLLIVFFMLTTVISATKGIEHILPQQDQEQTDVVEHEDSVYIKVNADNTFDVDRKGAKPISVVYELEEYLFPIVSRNYKKPIIVHVDPEARYESMIQVMDVLKQLEERLNQEMQIPNLTITIPTQAEAEAWGY